MSRSPNRAGVHKLRVALKDIRQLSAQLTELRKAASEVPKVEEAMRAADQEILKSLEEMGVSSNGNYGWENRIAWVLAELDRQASCSAND